MGGLSNRSSGASNKINDKKNYLPIISGNLEELLSSTIVDASICFFSMEEPMNFNNLIWEIIKKGILHHSGVILEMNNGKLILLEYGPYPHVNETRNNYYYPLGNGLRYSLIDIENIFERVFERTLLLINSQKLNNFGSWCVKVKARKQMTVNELFYSLGNNWKKKDYWAGSHDCQDFTIKVIELLDIESRYKSWYNRSMQNHKILKGFLYYIAKVYRVPRELANRIANYDEIDQTDDISDYFI